MAKEISKKHFETLKGLLTKQAQGRAQLGLIAEQKVTLALQLVDINKAINTHKQLLEDTYGQINIDMETGTYTDIEVEEKPKLKKVEDGTVNKEG